jgi:hypothetical protein
MRPLATSIALAFSCGLWSGCADVAAPGDAPAAPAVAPSLPSSDSVRSPAPAEQSPSPTPAVARSEPPSAVTRLTGAHTRVVWVQDLGDGTDFNGIGGRLVLMGLDSEDGRGERPILDAVSNYAKPLITADGERVVFSNRHDGGVYIVDWDGTGLDRLADGFALEVWQEPGTGTEWIYAGTEEADTQAISYARVRRHRIDDPVENELVWDRMPVSEDSFQLSADGRRASGVFPWPDVGLADLVGRDWTKLGEGCWTSFSPGGLGLLWYFDGSHRNLTLVDTARDERWRLPINVAPGIDGFEVYHPRWTSHPRFLTMTGPYAVGDASNKIRSGGSGVEVHLGRFSEDFRSIEAWTRVSGNDRADFYPDAWIDPAATGPIAAPAPVGADRASPDEAVGPPRRVVLEARVRRASPLPTPASIAPYREALLALEYQVIVVLDGAYPFETVVAAHWIIRDGSVLAEAERPLDRPYRLVLELYDDHPELEGRRLVMDADDVTLPLYYEPGSRP